jgi:murein DD-endopeptidase MepM/ murein hydrolase activator NlpD
MIESTDDYETIESSSEITVERAPGGICRSCGSYVAGRRYLIADASGLRGFCSETCLREGQSQMRATRWKARRRAMKVAVIGVAVAGACLAPHQGAFDQRPRKVVAAAPKVATGLVVPEGWFGPEWPPKETSLLAALGRDTWIHPLSGPIRRMPRADSRVFGAVRPGNRAVECRNGHCGVDLGGEIWGEHVRAVHDGVIDFVRRGIHAQRGGEFVRISHRNGTVFTQYFHVAAIPRWVERGVPVKSGDVIGLLGDTGVHDSAPHLHFTISIRPYPDKAYEKYMDPEPLVALWPLRVPLEGTERGLVTTVAEPGVPLGSMPLLPGKGKRKVAAKGKRGSAAAAAAGGDASPAADDGPADSGPPESGDE